MSSSCQKNLRIGLFFILVIFFNSCSGSGQEVKEIPGTQVQFYIPGTTGEVRGFFDFPWPNDLRIKDDGTLDLDGFPNPNNNDFLTYYLNEISANTYAFGTNAAVFFTFTAPIDTSTLPSSLEESLSTQANVFLVDIDPGSQERGGRIPVKLSFQRDPTTYEPANMLTVLPVFGSPLKPSTTYAAVITRSVKDTGGNPLGSPLAFEELKYGAGGESLEKLEDIYQPLFDLIESEAILSMEEIAGATVFTTQDPVSGMKAIRDFIVEELEEPYPESMDFEEEEAGYYRFFGRYMTPNFQTGKPPYLLNGGEILFDATGEPVLQYMENIRFALTVPKGVMPSGGWPIVTYAHGTGGDYESFIDEGVADVLAENGMAGIGIDQPLHGDRVEGGVDYSLLFFNFFNILAGRDNIRQAAADSVQLLRLARNLVIDAGTSPSGEEARFDHERIYFMGHSQGGTTGPLFVAVEPDVPCAVLSGSGGGFVITMLEKSDPFPILPIVELILGVAGKKEIDIFHPVPHMLQTFIEPADPLNYAPLFIRNPVSRPKNIFISEGLLDGYVPPHATEALATAVRANLAEPAYQLFDGVSLYNLGPLPPPISENTLSETGEWVTAVLVQYPENGHYAVFDNEDAKRQYGRFLATMTESGIATLE